MEEIKKFITENQNGYLATTENDIPRVRPFQYQFCVDNKYYFCTSNNKSVFEQLKKNPKVEWTVMSKKMDYARLNGEIIFEDNIKLKERMLEESPLVKLVYKKADNPIMEIFYIEHGEASISYMATFETKKYTF